MWSAVLALLVAACSSSAGSMEIPDGYRAYAENEYVTFAVPDHFEQTPPGDELVDGVEVEVLGEEEFAIEGATEALRVEFLRHHDQVDEPVRVTGFGVLVEDPDGLVVADLRDIAAESEFDEEIAASIQASLRVR